MAPNIADLQISSREFAPDGPLEERHAHDVDNEPPSLLIDGVPDDAVELAIICHDPDAPMPRGFTHWTLYGIPPHVTEIGPDADATYRPGLNDFGATGYGGPQPPAGHGPHRYYFWVFALAREVEGTPSRDEFLDTYGGDIIEQNRVVGVYER